MTLVAQPGTALDEALLRVLAPWLPARRWFPAKGASADLTLEGVLPLAETVRILLVRARAGSIDALLQVPLVLGPGPGELIGDLDGQDVRDGAADPRFLRAWLDAADGPGTDADPAAARMITGEQSNTSVILGDVAILKVLRALHPGENPDVDVPRRLVEEGWTHVPAPLAWLEGAWVSADGVSHRGYLGAMSAFVAGAEDGFELACAYAGRGESFADLARELGSVTATMHTALAHAFPRLEATDGPALVADGIAQRFSWATSAVPQLAAYAAGVENVLADVRHLEATPARQRVHGDLHLGQVLRAQDRWFVTDFEGEPLAPLEQRTRPDLAVRDVAGLLRSIDYAAAVGGLTGEAATAWADESRAALRSGYSASADEHTEVLTRALELDKTLYEAVYESRNRPSWLPIPLAALDRLVG
ncbi:maltokinase N-terminal cap-like domain-containing protein [Cellulomonas edaphi]|uniref:Maltokinase n=1 Tax=Cellulomonas edaphi TaxID=3053468 RepID=A0ABT7S9T8_9CELL|nr:aminoglycoside phosphotransferase [Cellulomons edaphi]MDM7832377.1 aminoglycoside phosphotransferase [Cellulomons edaphi]